MLPCRSDAMRDTPDASSASPQGNRPPSEHHSPRTAISLPVHGVRHHVDVEDRWTLGELLRDHLDLTGTAVWADGADVQTVEGLARDEHLSPLQQAFIEHNAPQC